MGVELTGTPNLQNVTDTGNITTDDIIITGPKGVQFNSSNNAHNARIQSTGTSYGTLTIITNNDSTGQFYFFDTNGTLNIGQGTTVSTTAKLAIVSTIAGFLPPRMTSTQKTAISSPIEGLMVYDLTLHKLCVFTGSVWETVTSL